MLHNETRKLLVGSWNKTHNAKEVAECFSVDTGTVCRLEKNAGNGICGNQSIPAWEKICFGSD